MTASAPTDPQDTAAATLPFLGLAPFLRMSIEGQDLAQVSQELLTMAEQNDDPNLWMNLATVMFCLQQRDVGLAIQAQAMAVQQVYHLAADHQPAKLRLLVLMTPGDISENTPIDCLLEDSDIDLIYCYIPPDAPSDPPIPDHDAVLVAISDAPANRPLLTDLAEQLAQWPRPVINAPQHIPNTEREAASVLLADAPGVVAPRTHPASRAQLQAVADGSVSLADSFPGVDFPVILRPVGSHAGHGLDRLDSAAEIGVYLDYTAGDAFFIAPFIDYRGADGQFRKCRVALVDGVPYASHMAVSSDWMIHYLNAGMYEDAAKRAEEAAFMADFADFAERHADALAAIHQRTGLDYLCIDCAETRDGRLLIFEIDHVMVVHAMDPVDLFPYKQPAMAKLKDAFRDYLLRITDQTA